MKSLIFGRGPAALSAKIAVAICAVAGCAFALTGDDSEPIVSKPIVEAALIDTSRALAPAPPEPTPTAEQTYGEPAPPETMPDEPAKAAPTRLQLASADPQQILPESAQQAIQAAPLPSLLKDLQDDGTTPFISSVNTIALLDECPVVSTCVDRYLWALYERAPKMDAQRKHERRKVKVRNKRGKLVTVTRTFTKIIHEDFTWKDPHAAEKAGMSMFDYVIGGMDKSFKLKLFHVLHAAEEAGHYPGITSAFRDDYRQGIATGTKAAANKSFHGGSLRGGYGRGVAADIVSVKGATRGKRWITTSALWKWIDERGPAYGIGRPYLDRDPPHVAPISGREYAMTGHRRPKAQLAKVEPQGKPQQQIENAKAKAELQDDAEQSAETQESVDSKPESATAESEAKPAQPKGAQALTSQAKIVRAKSAELKSSELKTAEAKAVPSKNAAVKSTTAKNVAAKPKVQVKKIEPLRSKLATLLLEKGPSKPVAQKRQAQKQTR